MKTSLRKLASGPLLPVGIAALYCLVIGFGVYVIDYHPRGTVQNFLLNNITWILRLNFLLLILGAVACGRDIAAAFRGLIVPAPAAPAAPKGASTVSEGAPAPAPVAEDAATAATAAPTASSAVVPNTSSASSPSPSAAAAKSSDPPAAWLQRHFRLLILAALLISAAVAVTSVAPRVHRIYYDEDIYGNVAQSMALKGQAAMCNYGVFEYDEYHPHWQIYNKEPSGWPFLVSMAFQIGGVDEEHGFRMNNLLYLGGILLCFWIVHIVTGRFFPAIMGALVWAAIPQNIVWSNTMAAEQAAAFFGGLAVLCLLVYLKTGRLRHLALLCLVVPLASQMRPESGLIGLWAFLALLVTTPRRLTRWEVWLLGIPALVFILPQFLHIHAVSGESWGAEGAKFSLEFFFKNIAVNGPYYLNNQLFPAVFTFLAFLGLAGPLRNRGRRDEDGPASAVSAGNAVGTVTAAPSRPDEAAGTDRIDVSGSSDLSRSRGGGWVKIGDEKGKGGVGPAARGARFVLPGLFLLWFVMFWGIFLFFYAGSYKYGADVRFALVSFMPLAVLAGMGADRLQAVITRLTYRLAARRPHTARAAAGRMRSPAPDPEPFGSPPLSGDDAGRPFRAGGALAAGLIFVLLLYSWLPFLPLIRLVSQEAWGARYDHAYARQFIEKIPRRSVVLTHVPTMLLLWQQGAIQTFAGINNPDIITELLKRYNGHVYFHHNYWCSTAGHHKELCSMMREKYELTEIAAAQEQHVHYGLYRIRFKENPH